MILRNLSQPLSVCRQLKYTNPKTFNFVCRLIHNVTVVVTKFVADGSQLFHNVIHRAPATICQPPHPTPSQNLNAKR